MSSSRSLLWPYQLKKLTTLLPKCVLSLALAKRLCPRGGRQRQTTADTRRTRRIFPSQGKSIGQGTHQGGQPANEDILGLLIADWIRAELWQCLSFSIQLSDSPKFLHSDKFLRLSFPKCSHVIFEFSTTTTATDRHPKISLAFQGARRAVRQSGWQMECPLRLSLDKATASICICKLVFRCNLPRKHQKQEHHRKHTQKQRKYYICYVMYTLILDGWMLIMMVMVMGRRRQLYAGSVFWLEYPSTHAYVFRGVTPLARPSNLILAFDNNRINNAFLPRLPDPWTHRPGPSYITQALTHSVSHSVDGSLARPIEINS